MHPGLTSRAMYCRRCATALTSYSALGGSDWRLEGANWRRLLRFSRQFAAEVRFGFRSGPRALHPHAVDAPIRGGEHFEMQTLGFDHFLRLRDPSGDLADQAPDGSGLEVLDRSAEQVVEPVYAKRAGNNVGILALAHDVRLGLVLVAQLTDDLLHHILSRDQAGN